MLLYTEEETENKNLWELIDIVHFESKPMFIHSINKHNAVILSLEQFYEMQQVYYTLLKLQKT